MSQVEQVFGAVKKCSHGQISRDRNEIVSPCLCCGNEVGFFTDAKFCSVCKLGIKRVDAPAEQVPEDYIEDRGPVSKVFADERPVEEAPPGYFKLLLGSLASKSSFVTLTEVEKTPWPYEDGTVTEAELGPIVCRLPLPVLVDVMCEIWRVLVPNGLLTISAPFYLHDSYVRDLRNITPVCEDTFGFFSQAWCEKNGVTPYSSRADFEPAGIRFHAEDEWTSRADRAKHWARTHYWGVVKKIEVVLRAVK